MTVGSMNTDNFFGLDMHGHTRDTSHLQYVTLSSVFWFLALFFMAILLSRLMVNNHGGLNVVIAL